MCCHITRGGIDKLCTYNKGFVCWPSVEMCVYICQENVFITKKIHKLKCILE